MASIWFSQIESKVLTYLQYNLKNKTNAPYPDLNCTTKSESTTPSVFPTLYIHDLSPSEQAQDLENDEVNAVLSTIEIQVFSNRSENETKQIISTAIGLMKDARWNITLFPDPQTKDKISYAIARFRKLVTESDIN